MGRYRVDYRVGKQRKPKSGGYRRRPIKNDAQKKASTSTAMITRTGTLEIAFGVLSPRCSAVSPRPREFPQGNAKDERADHEENLPKALCQDLLIVACAVRCCKVFGVVFP
jgi:hypothetical protein